MKKILALLFPSMTQSFVSFGPSKLTVDGALAQFNKVLDDLRKVKAAQDAEVTKQEKAIEAADTEHRRKVDAAEAAGEAAEEEARRAAKAIAKIEDFVL